jgi:hypothetical protein
MNGNKHSQNLDYILCGQLLHHKVMELDFGTQVFIAFLDQVYQVLINIIGLETVLHRPMDAFLRLLQGHQHGSVGQTTWSPRRFPRGFTGLAGHPKAKSLGYFFSKSSHIVIECEHSPGFWDCFCSFLPSIPICSRGLGS